MMNVARPTVRQVAELAGVSVGTVSDAFNRPDRVHSETRERVLGAAVDINYRPNYAARKLRSGLPGALGVITVLEDPGFATQRYVRELLAAITAEVGDLDFKIHMIGLPLDGMTPQAVESHLLDSSLDGLFVIASSSEEADALAGALGDFPAVFISAAGAHPGISYVNGDNFDAVKRLVQHLVGLGHQRIAIFVPENEPGDYRQRREGYEAAVAEARLPSLIFHGPLELEAPLDGALEQGCSAIIAQDDMRALRLLRLLEQRGQRVPEDVALVGFDDEEFAAHIRPALTTVRQPLTEMGRLAARCLLARMRGELSEPWRVILPVEVIVRESCGAALAGPRGGRRTA